MPAVDVDVLTWTDVDRKAVKLGASTDDALAEACDALFDGDEPATAVVCSDNLIAVGVLGQLKRRGLRIPSDVSVVAQPVYDMGREAARALLRSLGHGNGEGRLPLTARLRGARLGRRAAKV